MKKILFFTLLCAILIPFNANAESCKSSIEIKSIELGVVKGNAEELTEASIKDKKANLDLKLYDPGDSIEYILKVKNTSNEDYIFDNELPGLSADYVKYRLIYDDGSNVVEANKEETIRLIIEYVNRVPSDQLVNDSFDSSNTIVINFSSENANTPTNPDTLDEITGYILILAICGGICLICFKAKKLTKYITVVVGIVLIVPLSAQALCKSTIEVEARIQIDGKEAYFLPGPEVNVKMKQLAGDDTSTVANGYTFQDLNITSVKYSELEPEASKKEEKNTVSKADSPYPIYMWYENGIIYWWSEDKTPNLNENSSQMFRNINNLNDISGLSDYNAESVVNMDAIFVSSRLTDLQALSSWDTANVQSMVNSFANSYYIKNLNGIDSWDISKVTTIHGMFMNNYLLEDISSLKEWNVSRIESMRALFQNADNLVDITPLQSWDVSNVKTMNRMFFGNQTYQNGIKSLNALRNWNTASLEDMELMFQAAFSLESLEGLENWNVSNVKTMAATFNQCTSLKYGDLSNWDMSNVTTATYMFGNTVLQELKTPKVYPTNQSVKIALPLTLFDEDNNPYTELDNTSPTKTWLKIHN